MHSAPFQILSAAILFAATAAAQTAMVIPAGSQVPVRLIAAIDTAHARNGEEFPASLDEPLVDGDVVVARSGAEAVLRLDTTSQPSLTLVSFTAHGHIYAVQSRPHLASDPALTNRRPGALKGALIGAIGGGLIAGRIGVPLGACAGAAAGALLARSHKRHPRLPAETRIDFTLDQPVTVESPARDNSHDNE